MKQDELPKIRFENFKLKIALVKWLGIIPTYNKFQISRKILEFKNIETQFAQILKQAGIDCNETCLLKDYRKNDHSAICELQNSGKKIKIKFASYHSHGFPYYTFSVKANEETKCFNYDNGQRTLSLYSRIIINKENGNTCKQFLYASHIEFQIKNKDHQFRLRVNNSKETNTDDDRFKLENEEQLIEYLLGLTFPVNISELYRKIKEISGISTDKYPCFKLTTEQSNQTTSTIYVNAIIDEFIMKKGNITIKVAQNNWSYHSDEVSACKTDENIRYSIETTLNKPLSTEQQLQTIDEVVKQVKQFVKTL